MEFKCLSENSCLFSDRHCWERGRLARICPQGKLISADIEALLEHSAVEASVPLACGRAARAPSVTPIRRAVPKPTTPILRLPVPVPPKLYPSACWLLHPGVAVFARGSPECRGLRLSRGGGRGVQPMAGSLVVGKRISKPVSDRHCWERGRLARICLQGKQNSGNIKYGWRVGHLMQAYRLPAGEPPALPVVWY